MPPLNAIAPLAVSSAADNASSTTHTIHSVIVVGNGIIDATESTPWLCAADCATCANRSVRAQFSPSWISRQSLPD
ncbi:hypothetical protein BKP42_58320 [Rhodococcus erythropolis]|uniref:hypothetical protein n=1 Tax=Rhodococcus erythropolis TaxID=1833 RepID=UPI00117AE4C1|nr:hypothetical protein [Rhodococcus erythropolis]PBI89419.1 hypothetical protein BKP42_58320 [Rhodococcus erythropolis]